MRTLTIQTFNLWFGGACVIDGRQKIADVLRKYPSDIVALQETFHELGREATRELELNHVQQGFDTALVSHMDLEYIDTDSELNATAAWITVEGQRILLWSVHLHHMDYGPYAALKGVAHEEVLGAEFELRRLEQIQSILSMTEQFIGEKSIPVIIAGDFNSPATVDWNLREDRPSVNWRAIDVMHEAGFVDCFREIYPDPTTAPGDSWSQIEPLENEPRDRIDFIFARGLKPVGARMIGGSPHPLNDESYVDFGGPCELIPNQKDNAYPSDHMIFEVQLQV